MLTDVQSAALKAYILSVPALAAKSSGVETDYGWLADQLNLDAAGPVKAWRTSVPRTELVEASVDEIAVFDNLTAGKRDAWNLFLSLSSFDFSRNKIRSGVGKVWPNTQRDSILNACTENASVAENALGGSSVQEGTVTALKRNWIGTVMLEDVAGMFNV